LDRLDSGAYGTCEVCGSEIADALLEESPTTKRCPAHADGARSESPRWAPGAAVRSEQ
jgi:RNA polymerase-binding transcription factor DksA